MTRFLALALGCIALVACSQDNYAVEQKLDALAKQQARIMEMVAALGSRAGGAAAARPSRPAPDPAKTYAVPIDGDPVDGPATAAVTIVKAYDYACPYCDRVRETMTALRAKYGADLRIVFKQYVVHPQVAYPGALAACAAQKQDPAKFDALDRTLWDKGFKAKTYDQDSAGGHCWESAAGCPIVLGFAKEVGFDLAAFKADMAGSCPDAVRKDMADLQPFGAGGTPAFFINGRFLSGAAPIEQFSAIIDDELAKAHDRIAHGTPAASYYQTWVLDKGLKALEVAAR